MPNGREMVEQAIPLMREAAEGLQGQAQVEGAAKAAERLTRLATGLEGILNKIYLRTKACLAFTGPVLENAQKVREDVQDLQGAGGKGAWDNLQADLEALENEAQALIGKSSTGDVVIT